jgi:hypothetical protein
MYLSTDDDMIAEGREAMLGDHLSTLENIYADSYKKYCAECLEQGNEPDDLSTYIGECEEAGRQQDLISADYYQSLGV